MSNMNCPPTSRLHLTGIIFPVTGTVPPRIRQLRQHDHSEQHIPDAPIRASGLSGCHPDRYFPTLITVEHCPDEGDSQSTSSSFRTTDFMLSNFHRLETPY